LFAAAPAARGEESEADTLDIVLARQAKRIDMIRAAAPSVVCIYDESRRGGGSGVIIDSSGLGLTNFHVVAGMGDERLGWGGLNDGELYRLHVLGIDPTGDVAMFRLEGREDFPYSSLGDSDTVEVGDDVVAMGNPFSLSEDYSPTVTMGIVTGVHRYQWGVGNNLIYSDCIQTDASINPGNSGGPLFNMAGEIIGINGRISVNTRGRYNVGFGYAISANQIKRFMPAMRAGLLARHGTLQATVIESGDGVVFSQVPRGESAYRAGVRRGDRLIAIDGVSIRSPNHYVSVMGTYPADRHVLVEVERDGERMPLIARLDPIEPDMKGKYVVPEEVNAAEVKRVLESFHDAVTLSAGALLLPGATFSLNRGESDAAEGDHDTWSGTLTGDGRVRLVRQYDDGGEGPVITFNDTVAVKSSDADAEAFNLPFSETVAHRAMYLALRRLYEPLATLDISKVDHAGGDALITVDEDGGAPLIEELEVLNWPLDSSLDATIGFDRSSHLPRRISVYDQPSKTEIVLTIGDYREVGGLRLPHRIEVSGGQLDYVDVLSDWNIAP